MQLGRLPGTSGLGPRNPCICGDFSNTLLRRHLKPTNDSWRMDETYVRVKGKWRYLYRAVDSTGATLDFLLSAKQDAAAAKRFLAKAPPPQHVERSYPDFLNSIPKWAIFRDESSADGLK